MTPLLRLLLQGVGALTLVALLAAWGLCLFAGHWMRVNETPVRSDYILPLAGDKHRLIKAAELYRQGNAPTILVSLAYDPPPDHLKRLEWAMGFPRYTKIEYARRLYAELGIPDAPLEPFGHGHISTVEEAEALRAHLKGRAVGLLIVTSPSHARRAKMIFEHELPDCRITLVSTEDGRFADDWWKVQRDAQLVVMEFAKTLHYLLGGAFRSSDPAERNQSAASFSE